jgi:hypothetical protein
MAWCDPLGALGRDEAVGNVLNPNSSLGDIQNEPKGVAIAEINGLRSRRGSLTPIARYGSELRLQTVDVVK